MRVVGLTGGIGSGKSVVARMLAERGAEIIDADQLAREVVEPGGSTLPRIVERFGSAVLDDHGRLDRRKLGQIVFKDERLLGELNQIVHPAVHQLALERIASLGRKGAKVVVYDVPLLYEVGLDRWLQEIIVVSASLETRKRRIAARDHLSPEEIEERIHAQIPLEEKLERATFVIDNGGSLEDTRVEVDRLWERLCATGGAP